MQLTKNYGLPQYTDPNDRFNKEDYTSAFKKIDDAVGDLQETFSAVTKESFVTKQNVDEMKTLNTTVKENINNLIMLDGVNADSKVNLTNLTAENTDAKVTKTNLTLENTDSKLTLNGLTLLNTDAKATLSSLTNTNMTASDILAQLNQWSTTGENIIAMNERIEANTTKLATFDTKMLEQETRINQAIETQNTNIDLKISTAESNFALIGQGIQDNATQQINTAIAKVGDLTQLKTTNKENIVLAVNEIKDGTGDKIGDIKQFANAPDLTWLKCNGTVAKIAEYPELYEFSGGNASTILLGDVQNIPPVQIFNTTYLIDKSVCFKGKLYAVVGGYTGLFRSEDNGLTWTRILQDQGKVTSLKVRKEMLFVCSLTETTNNATLNYSIDGIAFTVLASKPSSSGALPDFECGDNEYIFTYTTAINKSTNLTDWTHVKYLDYNIRNIVYLNGYYYLSTTSLYVYYSNNLTFTTSFAVTDATYTEVFLANDRVYCLTSMFHLLPIPGEGGAPTKLAPTYPNNLLYYKGVYFYRYSTNSKYLYVARKPDMSDAIQVVTTSPVASLAINYDTKELLIYSTGATGLTHKIELIDDGFTLPLISEYSFVKAKEV